MEKDRMEWLFSVCQGEGKPCTVNRHGQRTDLAKDQSHRWVNPLVGGSPHELCYFGLDMYCLCGYILHVVRIKLVVGFKTLALRKLE
jgi:hypothetical protein